LISAAVFVLVGDVGSLGAQQTLFNVPSSDVLDRGKLYAELDASFQTVHEKLSSFVPRLVVGLGGRFEAGLNITGNLQPGRDKTTLVPTIKWKAYDGGVNGWAVVAGDSLFIPVHFFLVEVGINFNRRRNSRP
jgi:hypothetical protein